MNTAIAIQGSPVDKVTFRGRPYFIKRDDLLYPFPGNKARKLQQLLKLDWSQIHCLVSHGGNQSNAMLALARLAKFKKKPFHYYTRPLPGWLKKTPTGNLRLALKLGMQLFDDTCLPNIADFSQNTLFVPQGVSMPEAEPGLLQLATEITGFIQQQKLKDPIIFVPSGTGATSLFLQKNIDSKVYTTPVVGDKEYLLRQFLTLTPGLDKTSEKLPQIITSPQKHPFGKPDREFITLWKELKKSTGIEFDLLYDPAGWIALLQLSYDGPIIYIHCGGTEGNETMLSRYRRQGLYESFGKTD